MPTLGGLFLILNIGNDEYDLGPILIIRGLGPSGTGKMCGPKAPMDGTIQQEYVNICELEPTSPIRVQVRGLIRCPVIRCPEYFCDNVLFFVLYSYIV